MRVPFTLATAVALIGLGIVAIRQPRMASGQYGLPVRDKAALGYVRALGARDLTLGLLLLAAKPRRKPTFLLLAGLALADFFTVSSTSDDPPPSSLAIHFAGAIGLAALSLGSDA